MRKIKEQIRLILSITKYSMLMYFRDKTAIFFSLFVPILIMSIFGVLNFGEGTEIKLGIVDEAKNQMSTQVVEGIKKIEAFQIEEGAKNEEMDKISRSDVDMVLVLPKELGSDLRNINSVPQNVEVYYDQNQNQSTTQIGMTILDKTFDQITHQVSKTPTLFKLEQKSVSTQELTFVDFLIPGIAAMSIMNMSILGVIGAITSWRERGILKRLLATPIRPASIIFGQVSSRLIISIGQVAVLITLGILFFDLTIVGSLFNVFVLTALGAVVFLSMGLAASGVAKTQNSVMAIGNLISMPQMFLSGIFFPLSTLPEWLSNITQYMPLTYLADGLREVMIHGATLSQVRTDIIGLSVWCILCFVIASKFFSWE